MDGINAALTGLNVTGQGLALTSNNIANVQSRGYQSESLRQSELAEGGVAASGVEASQEPTYPGGSNVDLAAQATNLLAQGQNYGADLAFVKTQEKIVGTALDFNA
jgi:flagellar hook protein FlgE